MSGRVKGLATTSVAAGADRPKTVTTTLAQRTLLRRASTCEQIGPETFGDHSAARILVKRGWLRQAWIHGQISGDRVAWAITNKGRRMLEAIDANASEAKT